MLFEFIISFLIGIATFFIIGWTTGDKEYGGIKTKDDERSQVIKQKAIVSSWLLLVLVLFMGFIFNLFNFNQVRSGVNLEYPELFYLLLLVGSYFIYYWIYNRRLSSNEK